MTHEEILQEALSLPINDRTYVAARLLKSLNEDDGSGENELERRARRGNQELFEAVLSKVPHVAPDPEDRLD